MIFISDEDESESKRKKQVINQSIFSKNSGSRAKNFPSLKLSSNLKKKEKSLKLLSPLVRKKQKLETAETTSTMSETLQTEIPKISLTTANGVKSSSFNKDVIMEKTSGILSLSKYNSSSSSENE